MTKQIAKKEATLLPSLAGASPELMERMKEVQDNLESVDSFKLPRVKMTSDGFEIIEGEPVIQELDGVLIHTKKTNVYYKKPYKAGAIEPPDCYSLDGVTPAMDMKDKAGKPVKPINPTCKGCKMAEYGTNTMGTGKACRNLKPLFLLLGDEAIIPRQLTITPTSLKAANQYLMDLTERGLSYRKVKTKITAYKENTADKFVKLKFSLVSKLDDTTKNNVEFLKNKWLPVMNNQVIDQNEVDRGENAKDVSNGEY